MTKPTHLVLVCDRSHEFHWEIPTDRKIVPGEHVHCPKCHCNAFVVPHAKQVVVKKESNLKLAPEGAFEAEAVKILGTATRPAILDTPKVQEEPEHADPAEEHVLSEEEYLDDGSED